jgi:hypothetical protein
MAVNFASAGQAQASDFSARIDGASGQEIQRRIPHNQSVDVGHHALPPQKRPRVEVRVQGHANRRAIIVDADAVARLVAGECAQVLNIVTGEGAVNGTIVVSPATGVFFPAGLNAVLTGLNKESRNEHGSLNIPPFCFPSREKD